uniref:Uncharacterized protein n=2 Tax=Solanum tuberosum TaxID=4113 RepID=M1ANM3_SOLTU
MEMWMSSNKTIFQTEKQQLYRSSCMIINNKRASSWLSLDPYWHGRLTSSTTVKRPKPAKAFQ